MARFGTKGGRHSMNDMFPPKPGKAGTDEGGPERPVANLRDLLLLFRRRRWLIGVGTVLGTLVAVAIAVSREPQFTAQAALIIDPRKTPIAGIKSAAQPLDTDAVTLTTQVNVIKSREQMADVVQDLHLEDDPVLGKSTDRSPLDRFVPPWLSQTIKDIPTRWLTATGFADELPEMLHADTAEPDPAAEERALDEFARRFVVRQADTSQVINISFTYPDPTRAAEVANRAADLYVADLFRAKVEDADRVGRWVSGRLADLARMVHASEHKVAEYRVDQGLTKIGTGRADEDQLTNLRGQLADSTAQLSALQSKAAIVAQLQKRSDIDALVGMFSSPMLITLREQELDLQRRQADLSATYGPRHPQILLLENEKAGLTTKIAEEVSRLRFDLESQMHIEQAKIANIQEQMKSFETDQQRRDVTEVGLSELETEADSNRQLAQIFREYYKEISDQQGIIEPDARVLAYAKPPSEPSSLSSRLFAFLGLTASFAGSTLLALVLEGIDRRVRSARQLERAFGVRVLEAVPHVAAGGRSRRILRHLFERPRSAYAEGMRSVYATLRLSLPSDRPPVVMVASALASEGKSTFVVSLAAVAAQWGQRVLVIDLDLRHPSVAETVQQRLRAGIAELVNEEVALEEALERTAAGFDLIGVVRRPTNPSGLIGDPRARRLVETLRGRYDLIVIDSAPILAVSDGRVASQLADTVVIATQWRWTPLSAVRRTLQLLRDAHAHIAGFVLLRVDPRYYMYYENEDGANYYKNLKKYYVK